MMHRRTATLLTAMIVLSTPALSTAGTEGTHEPQTATAPSTPAQSATARPAPAKPATAQSATKTNFDYPAGRAGEVAAAYLSAFNSGDELLVREFHLTHGPDSANAAESLDDTVYQYRKLHALLGALLPQSSAKVPDVTLLILAKSEKTGTFFHVGFRLDEDGRLLSHFVRPAPKPGKKSVQRADASAGTIPAKE